MKTLQEWRDWTLEPWGPNWNWKREDKLEYQIRFPKEGQALLYKVDEASSKFLAVINTISAEPGARSAEIRVPKSSSDGPDGNEEETLFKTLPKARWQIKVRTLGDKELEWELVSDIASGSSFLRLTDPKNDPEETIASADDCEFAIRHEFPEGVVDELVVTGSAVQILIASSMTIDFSIATSGPEAKARANQIHNDGWELEGWDFTDEESEN